jgi:hypothetical protein
MASEARAVNKKAATEKTGVFALDVLSQLEIISILLIDFGKEAVKQPAYQAA